MIQAEIDSQRGGGAPATQVLEAWDLKALEDVLTSHADAFDTTISLTDTDRPDRQLLIALDARQCVVGLVDGDAVYQLRSAEGDTPDFVTLNIGGQPTRLERHYVISPGHTQRVAVAFAFGNDEALSEAFLWERR